MNKKYIIRKNEEISKIMKNCIKKNSEYFVFYFRKSTNNYNRYCISISKKIGKAHIRNYYKRVIKDILMKKKFNKSCDCVIIVRKAVTYASYDSIMADLTKIMEGEI